MSRRVAIGLGCRTGVSAEAVLRLADRLAGEAEGEGRPWALLTIDARAGEPGLAEAARALGLPLIGLPVAILRQAADRTLTRSERVEALHGVPSVAETAALAGAGPGSRLIGPRLAEGGVTAALAIGAGGIFLTEY